MPYFAHAKVNIFLKIVGTRDTYHEIQSRFVKVQNLFDTLEFKPKTTNDTFELVGDFNCTLEHNTIYKMYEALKKYGYAKEVDALLRKVALHVKKKIPTGAGLGGGSSDSATFLKMVNVEANLHLSDEVMFKMALHVGADVAFFIAGFNSANVSGIGEKVEYFEEEPLDIEVFTPEIACDTGLVYRTFRECFMQEVSSEMASKMSMMKSIELVHAFSREQLNDLFKASTKAYPQLLDYATEGWFFSGSGSSFFRMVENG